MMDSVATGGVVGIKTEKLEYWEVTASREVEMAAAAEEVNMTVKSCIMSRKGGIPIGELNKDYQELVGEAVPIKRLGFECLVDYLKSIPGVTIENNVVQAASDKTKHIAQLISKQKDPPKKKFHKNRYTPYRSSQAPHYNKKYQKSRNYPPQLQQSYCPKPQLNSAYPPQSKYYPKEGYKKAPAPYDKKSSQNYRPTIWDNEPISLTQREESNWLECEDCFNCLTYYERKCNYHHLLEINAKLKNWYLDHCSVYSRSQGDEFGENEFWFDDREQKLYMHGHQMIGDDFVLDLITEKQSADSYILCESGMTVKKALLGVRQRGCSEQVVIAIGSSDILRGIDGSELILDMTQLIQTVKNTGAKVKVCTIPPMPNIKGRFQAIAAVNTFNRWLRSGVHGAGVIDLNAIFKNGSAVKYGLFEKKPIYTYSGITVIPWSHEGRGLVQLELKKKLNYS